jgi:hypothetical protein
MADSDLIDGGRGILTERDREYLLGEINFQEEYKNPEHQREVIKDRLCNRIERGIRDFILIDRYITKEEWDEILEGWEKYESEVKEEASRTGEPPDMLREDRPDIINGAQAGMRCSFNLLIRVWGMELASVAIKENLKQSIQEYHAIHNDKFYYGDVSLQDDDFEENSIDLDEAWGYFADEIDKQTQKDGEYLSDDSLLKVLNGFTEKLPDMAFNDYHSLVAVFSLTGRLSEDAYRRIGSMMEAIVWDGAEPLAAEEIEDWNILMEEE